MDPDNGDCPYCGQPRAGAEINDDHIFVKARGGRAVVRVHKDCNSRLGAAVEGRLMRPGEQLNLKLLRGHVGGDPEEEVELDTETGDLRFRRPVLTEDDLETGDRTYNVRGEREEVRARLEGPMGSKLDLSSLQVDNLIEAATPLTEPIDFVTELRFDLHLSAQLVAKVALGALARVAPEATASPLASDLREILWGRQTVARRAEAGILDEIVELARGVAVHIAPLGPQPSDGESPPSRAVFVPIGSGTAIFVFIGHTLLSFSGLLVGQPCPVGSGLGLAVVDAVGGVRVRDVALELAAQVSQRG